MSSLQTSNSSEPHLLTCKDTPRKYLPPAGTYAVVKDGKQLRDVVMAPGSGSRFIRVSSELRYMELLEPLVIPKDVSVTVDCQGAVIDFQPLPAGTVPPAGSVLSMLDCCAIGMSIGPEYPAEVSEYADFTWKVSCGVRFMDS